MASSVSYTSLEPSFSSALGVSAPTFKTGDALSLFTSTSFLYSLGIMLSVVAAGVMYARAGVWRMEASERGVKRSNEEIKRTTLGLFGVLSLFAIIYTFNADLLTGNVGLAGLKAGPVAGAGGGITTGTTSGAVGGQVGGGTTTPTVGGSEQANRNTLAAAGISINNAPCADASSRNCTNVGNINPASIAVLLKLKAECNCTVFVTAGSEPNGHSPTSNHGPGKEAIDIRYNKELGDFLMGKTVVGNTPPCNIKRGYSGFVFWDEPVGCEPNTKERHFHASFTGR